MKKCLSAVAAAVLIIALAGCGNPAPATPAVDGLPEGDIVLGMLTPLTGQAAIYGTSCKNGARLAADEINALGGIGGHRIALEIVDDKGEVNGAIDGYSALVDSGAVAVIGPVTSKAGIAVAGLAAMDGVPMVTPSGTAAGITEAGGGIYRTCFLDTAQAAAMVGFAGDTLGAKSVAVLYNASDEYSAGVAEAFKTGCEAAGIAVLAYESYTEGDRDFTEQLTIITEQDVDAIMVPDYCATAARIAIQAREADYWGTLLGADGWEGVVGAVPEGDLDLLNNCFFTAHYPAGDTGGAAQGFTANYQARYGEAPSSFAALGYDTVYLVKAAIERAGSTESDAVTAALSTLVFEGVTGGIRFDELGNPQKDVWIIGIVDGEYTLHSKIHAER